MVGDPADTGSRDRRAEHVAEETGKAGRGAGSLLGHEIERVQADDHDRPINQETDRDERRVVDPQRALHVEPVHDDGDERQAMNSMVAGARLPLNHLSEIQPQAMVPGTAA